MRTMLLTLSIIFSIKASACKISWEKLSIKTPFNTQNVRPQGITIYKNKIILSNHYKDSKTKNRSDLLILNHETMAIEKRLSFPTPYYHIAGLSSDKKDIFAVDFNNQDLLKINMVESIEKEKVIYESILKLPISGASGVSIKNDIVAISHYIVPYRSPYLGNRYIRFFDLKSGNEIYFNGGLKSSNYSQGVTFIKIGKKDFLLETINRFGSVLKYWVTGKDYTKDLVRVYKIDFNSRKIQFITDIQAPLNMIEDLVWIRNNEILTTDEQNFTFYKGMIINC